MSVAVITARELADHCSGGNTPDVIDVRTPGEFREVHLEAARNVPLDRLDPAAFMAGRGRPADEPVYVLCRSGGRGKQACEAFQRAGFSNAVNVEGGTLACVAEGLPVVRGKKAVSLERQVRIAAGSLVLVGVALALLAHPGFIGLSAFVGVFAGLTDTCTMGLLLARMPWNRVPANSSASCPR
jgi:rhodanese-related sulfurtransferase